MAIKSREKWSNDQQVGMAQRVGQLNFDFNEQAANNAHNRQMEMYERTYQDNSPANRVKQLEEAGLSIGLMYGGAAGTGGMGQVSSAPQGAGAQGIQPKLSSVTDRQMAKTQTAALALEIGKTASEIDLNNSIATKNQAETQKISGVDTEVGKAQYKSITAATENTMLEAQGIKLDNQFSEMRNEIKSATKEKEIASISNKADQAYGEMLQMINKVEEGNIDLEIKKQTKESIIESYDANLAYVIEQTLVKKSERAINEEQAKKIVEEIKNLSKQIELKEKDQSIAIKQIETQLMGSEVMGDAIIESAWINLGKDAMKEIINMGTKFYNPAKTIKGFGK